MPFLRSLIFCDAGDRDGACWSSIRSPTYVAKIVPPERRVLALLLLLVPFWAGEVIRTFSVIMLLANRGAVNMVLRELGLIERPIPMLYTYFSLGFGVVYLLCLYMLLPLYSAIEKIPRHLIDAAADLGAGPFTRFRRVILPLSRDGIVVGLQPGVPDLHRRLRRADAARRPEHRAVPGDDRQLLPRRQRQVAGRRRLRDDHARDRAHHGRPLHADRRRPRHEADAIMSAT